MFSGIKRVKKMGAIAFLMIVQLSIGLTMINTSGKLFEESQTRKKGIDDLFNVENSLMFRIVPSVGLEKGNLFRVWLDGNKAESVFNEMKELGLISKKLVYAPVPNVLGIDELIEKIPNKYKNLSKIQKEDYTSNILINKEFYKHYDLKISSGRNFKDSDFDLDYKTTNIPILLGKDFEGIFELGKVFPWKDISNVDEESSKKSVEDTKLEEDTVNFEVVGFLERNAIPTTTLPNQQFATSIIYSDIIAIIPTVKDFIYFTDGRGMAGTGVILEYPKGTDVKNLEETLQKKLRAYDLKGDEISLGAKNLITETYDRDVKSSIALGVLLLVLSMVGTSCIILGQLNKRKREFGIKIAMGATLKDISRDIIIEVLCIVIAASIISLFLNLKVGIGINILILNLCLVTVMTILISIFPVREIKKMNVVELVKEN